MEVLIVQRGKSKHPVIVFFARAAWFTALILIPLFILSNNFFAIEQWWKSNPYNGLWFVVPALIVLGRQLYKTIKQRS